MGQNKLTLEVGAVSLLDRVRAALSSCCEEVLVAGGYAPAETHRIPDRRPGRQGPLAGIEAGMLAARHRFVFVAAGDMPFLTAGVVDYLLGLLQQGAPVVVPISKEGSHPLCAAYDREEILPAVSAALDRGDRTVRGLVEGMPGTRYVGEDELRRFGDPELLLLNVNSLRDLVRARKALEEGTHEDSGV
jgi:molybdenum cofactor guanylyltransferase